MHLPALTRASFHGQNGSAIAHPAIAFLDLMGLLRQAHLFSSLMPRPGSGWIEHQMFAEEGDHEILKAEGHIADVRPGIDLKAVGDPIVIKDLVKLSGIDL
jgi:hypothetical protein